MILGLCLSTRARPSARLNTPRLSASYPSGRVPEPATPSYPHKSTPRLSRFPRTSTSCAAWMSEDDVRRRLYIYILDYIDYLRNLRNPQAFWYSNGSLPGQGCCRYWCTCSPGVLSYCSTCILRAYRPSACTCQTSGPGLGLHSVLFRTLNPRRRHSNSSVRLLGTRLPSLMKGALQI